jgi:hypothetical protein
MQENRGPPLGVARNLPIHCMVPVEIEHAALVRFDLGEELILRRRDVHEFHV